MWGAAELLAALDDLDRRIAREDPVRHTGSKPRPSLGAWTGAGARALLREADAQLPETHDRLAAHTDRLEIVNGTLAPRKRSYAYWRPSDGSWRGLPVRGCRMVDLGGRNDREALAKRLDAYRMSDW